VTSTGPSAIDRPPPIAVAVRACRRAQADTPTIRRASSGTRAVTGAPVGTDGSEQRRRAALLRIRNSATREWSAAQLGQQRLHLLDLRRLGPDDAAGHVDRVGVGALGDLGLGHVDRTPVVVDHQVEKQAVEIGAEG
jgi:hypothetical protein